MSSKCIMTFDVKHRMVKYKPLSNPSNPPQNYTLEQVFKTDFNSERTYLPINYKRLKQAQGSNTDFSLFIYETRPPLLYLVYNLGIRDEKPNNQVTW